MGKNSKYYKDLRKSKLAKINEMKCQLPLYTHSYIEKCVLKKQINTVYADTQDIVIFLSFLKPKIHCVRILKYQRYHFLSLNS